MTSRERLINTLEGKPADRVPVSTYELCPYNPWAFENREPSYAALMEFIRANTDAVTMWNPDSNDRQVFSSFVPDDKYDNWDEGEFHVSRHTIHTPKRDLTQISKCTDNVITSWNVEHICKDTADVDALMNLPFEPVQYNPGNYEEMKQNIGENGIIMPSVPDPVCCAMDIMEFGEGTVWAMTEPDHFKATLDEMHRRSMINLENMLSAVTNDLYRICGPEYVTPPYLSPKHFERFVFPYLCDMVELIHKHGGRARIHCHGKVGTVLQMIIDTGADAIDPCEAPPDGDITLADAKKFTDGKITIFGNIQLKLLENGTEKEVSDYVRKCMYDAKEGGRYIIMPTAAPINIPLSPKTEANYRAYINAALEFGQY
ncbi:hypothetical protein FACS1894105_02370 [Clostridia bacterium]|nr:hypothetical protein FACS1894105_02340 [Clostridia bacterium]GHU34844.1 hypothetical protein FACS1894105_02370 [Clostridia bacterium]